MADPNPGHQAPAAQSPAVAGPSGSATSGGTGVSSGGFKLKLKIGGGGGGDRASSASVPQASSSSLSTAAGPSAPTPSRAAAPVPALVPLPVQLPAASTDSVTADSSEEQTYGTERILGLVEAPSASASSSSFPEPYASSSHHAAIQPHAGSSAANAVPSPAAAQATFADGSAPPANPASSASPGLGTPLQAYAAPRYDSSIGSIAVPSPSTSSAAPLGLTAGGRKRKGPTANPGAGRGWRKGLKGASGSEPVSPGLRTAGGAGRGAGSIPSPHPYDGEGDARRSPLASNPGGVSPAPLAASSGLGTPVAAAPAPTRRRRREPAAAAAPAIASGSYGQYAQQSYKTEDALAMEDEMLLQGGLLPHEDGFVPAIIAPGGLVTNDKWQNGLPGGNEQSRQTAAMAAAVNKLFPVGPPPKTGSGFLPALPLDKNTPKPRSWKKTKREIMGPGGVLFYLPVWLGDNDSPFADHLAANPRPPPVEKRSLGASLLGHDGTGSPMPEGMYAASEGASEGNAAVGTITPSLLAPPKPKRRKREPGEPRRKPGPPKKIKVPPSGAVTPVQLASAQTGGSGHPTEAQSVASSPAAGTGTPQA